MRGGVFTPLLGKTRSERSDPLLPLCSTAPCSTLHANHIVIYQFIPVAAVRVMERLIRSMGTGTMAVLDLEDGYLDVRDEGNDENGGVRRIDLLQ